ncbi:MAG: hypothetical protein AAGI72_17085 [Pseudomonadota bacterium]
MGELVRFSGTLVEDDAETWVIEGIVKLEDALEKIACQWNHPADPAEAYDRCIEIAREALS